jgi:hypothetical protein
MVTQMAIRAKRAPIRAVPMAIPAAGPAKILQLEV